MTTADRLMISLLNGEGSALLTLQEDVVLVFMSTSRHNVTMYQVAGVDLDLPPVYEETRLQDCEECELCNKESKVLMICGQCKRNICGTCYINIDSRARSVSNALGAQCPYCRYDDTQHLQKALLTV